MSQPRTRRQAVATVTVEFLPPEYRAQHNVPDDITYYAVVDQPGQDRIRIVPDSPATRPDAFAHAVGELYRARVVRPGPWLDLWEDLDGRWMASDSRRCHACGLIKGVPMCCDDPITKREMMILGQTGEAPWVPRQRTAVAS